jgi:hypothetical protein
LAATMMKRYLLCSRSSGIVYIALFFRLSAMCLLTSILEVRFCHLARRRYVRS